MIDKLISLKPSRCRRVLAGSQATGSQATGSQATGRQATGRQATGRQATGSQATGSHPAASHPAGLHPAGSHPTGSHPAASHPAGRHPAASHPAASHPAASHPAGRQAAGRHPAAGILAKACLFGLMLLAMTCARSEPLTFELDPTPVLSGGLGWVVVASAYVNVKSGPGYDFKDNGFVRRGDILRIMARERAFAGRSRGNWFQVAGDGAEGWLHETAVLVFASREQAANSREARR
jgi:hypothetical protein